MSPAPQRPARPVCTDQDHERIGAGSGEQGPMASRSMSRSARSAQDCVPNPARGQAQGSRRPPTRRRCSNCPRGENPEAAVELPLDRPPVQSCMRRRLAIVHTASGMQCPIPHYATAGHSKKMLEAALQKTACGRERWRHRNSDVGLAQAMPLSLSPAGRSNTAKGQTSRALPRRAVAARLCGPVKSRRAEHRRNKTKPAMHDPRRAASGTKRVQLA
jgi:hypothetical protein